MAVRVNVVLLVIDKTVPIATLPAVFIMLPTLISVRNSEPPAPVTIADAVDVVIVPVRVVLGHAVELQFPVPADEITAAIAPGAIITIKISDRIRIFKDCKNGLLIGIGFFA